jgi:hypothetical protein
VLSDDFGEIIDTRFAQANIRLTRSQRRGIELSPLQCCVWSSFESIESMPSKSFGRKEAWFGVVDLNRAVRRC